MHYKIFFIDLNGMQATIGLKVHLLVDDSKNNFHPVNTYAYAACMLLVQPVTIPNTANGLMDYHFDLKQQPLITRYSSSKDYPAIKYSIITLELHLSFYQLLSL